MVKFKTKIALVSKLAFLCTGIWCGSYAISVEAPSAEIRSTHDISNRQEYDYQISNDFQLDIQDDLGHGEIYGRFAVSEDVDDSIVSFKMKISRFNNQNKPVWTVRDFVNDCDAPGIPELKLLTPVHTTDLDGNGLKEVWMMYKLSCRTEAFPTDLKIIMYEGKTKHAMRGKTDTRVIAGICESTGECGKYKMDDNLRKAKPVIKNYAKKLWVEHMGEYPGMDGEN